MLFDEQRTKRWARWVYGGLAAVFAISFIGFGAGGNLSYLPTDVFGGGDSASVDGESADITELRSAAEATPENAEAWRKLGDALASDPNRQGDAAEAYEKVVVLRPDDIDALRSVANLASGEAARLTRLANEYAQAAFLENQVSPAGLPFMGGSSALGSALRNPFQQAESSSAGTKAQGYQEIATQLQTQASEWSTRSVEPLQKLSELEPNEPKWWLDLGSAAQQAGDTEQAITAYEKFLELAPEDIAAPQVKEIVASLKGEATPADAGTTTTP